MYFRANLKIIFMDNIYELNFTVEFLLIRKTWDSQFVDKVRCSTPMFLHCPTVLCKQR